MSDCIIRIKIGDSWITLDPNSNISPDNKEFLINSLDVNRLRSLYSSVRDGVDFDKDIEVDPAQADVGRALYESLANEANAKGEFLSPVAALKGEKNPEAREAMAAYIKSLNGKEVLTSGNFLLDAKDAYKLSPYAQKDIQKLIFNNEDRFRSIYSLLTNAPGMETIRISIAYANEVNGHAISTPAGRYLRPDGIVQVIVPDGWYTHSANDKGVTKTNLDDRTVTAVRKIIIHELSHAVLSEVYISDPAFRESIDKLHADLVTHLDKLLEPNGSFLSNTYEPKDQKQTTSLRKKFTQMKDLYATPGTGVHEFLSNLLEDKALWDVTNLMISKDSAYESAGNKNLYDRILNSLPSKYAKADSALKDGLAVLTAGIPTGVLSDTLTKSMIDYVDSSDKYNIFSHKESITDEELDGHLGSREQSNGFWTINARAYRMSEEYLKRISWEKGDDKTPGKASLKNAHYGVPIEKPTQAQIDQLYSQDLVLVPWLRWNDLPDGKGNWVERGVLVDDKGNIKTKDKKAWAVDIVRDSKGAIIQDNKDGRIQEMFNHLPVMYTNPKTSTATLAKVGLSEKAGQKDWEGYNTVSIPYSFIRGIRKYDWRYFDHTHDYVADKASIEQQLKEAKSDNAVVARKFDRVSYLEKLLSHADDNIQRAIQVTQELQDLSHKYSFTRVEDDGQAKTFYKNVSRQDYINSGWDTKNLGATVFADDNQDPQNPAIPIFSINKKAGGYMSEPNRQMFQILWQADSGSEFAKASTYIAEAVTKGDMVRINKPEEIGGVMANRYDWLPVYQRVANGVLVGTGNGKGYIVSFGNIDAYAKNTTTPEWEALVTKQKNAIDTIEEDIASDKTEKKAGGRDNRVEQGRVFYKSLRIGKAGEENDELTKFVPKTLEYAKSLIQPGHSFVRVQRKFVPDDPINRTPIERPSNELVVAKSDEGVVTMRFSNAGRPFLDHIKYTDSVDEGQNYGKQLLFLMEDLGAAREMWAEGEREQALFRQNSAPDKPAFTQENGSYKANFDFKENPRKMRDWYDVYETVNGVNVGRLTKGDMVGIKLPEGGELPRYFRKVLRVLDDGRIAVVENRKEPVQWKSGGVGKAGIYIRYIDMSAIDRVAYKIGRVTGAGTEEDPFTSQFHQDILDRRKKMLSYADADKDWNDFEFAYTKKQVANFNKAMAKKGKTSYYQYVPLTSKILDPKSVDEPIFLDRDLNETDEKNTAYVKAWVQDGRVEGARRGIISNTKFFDKKLVIDDSGKKTVLKDIVAKVLMSGDWIAREYVGDNNKKRTAYDLIDRIENGTVYTIMKDLSTRYTNLKNIKGIALSVRNNRWRSNDGLWAKWERADQLWKTLNSKRGKESIDLPFKSPADSQRALRELGNRLQTLNPDFVLHYDNQADLNLIRNRTGYDYSGDRAFILQGEVHINLQKASISDVVHEYTHLFLHTVKYDSPTLYQALISKVNSHPLYDQIAGVYSHLQGSDLQEEVFVTLLGEYMKGNMNSTNKLAMEQNKTTVVQFSEYTKEKLEAALQGKKLQSVTAAEILNMRLEDVLSMVGDKVMNNRISDTYDKPELSFGRDTKQLAKDLKERGLLIEECYG